MYVALKQYLAKASVTMETWGKWLNEHEQLLIVGDAAGLEAHTASADQLHHDLAELRQSRATLLAEAHSAGLPCENLKQLAMALPQWKANRSLRDDVMQVERQMANLRRLNTAAWLLVSQCCRVVDETLLLMTCGHTTVGAYISVPQADTAGGQFFDTEI